MATVANILTNAYGYSDAFIAAKVADETNELTPLLDRVQKRYFARAARLNPRFFAKKTVVAASSNKWALPGDCVGVPWLIQTTAGAEVHIVALEDTGSQFAPRVYLLGQDLLSVGTAGDPDDAADSLWLFHARLPGDLTITSSVIDADWPDQYLQIFDLEVAIYLSGRARLNEDIPALEAMLARVVGELDAEVSASYGAESRRFKER